jgi:hypothetical protein
MAKKPKIGKLKNTIAVWKQALLGETVNKPSAQDMARITGLPTFHDFDRHVAGQRCPNTPHGHHRFNPTNPEEPCWNCGGAKP